MLAFYLSMLSAPEDQEKMRALYIQYRQMMFTAAMSILHRTHDAEDAVHEAFIRVAKNLYKIGDPEGADAKYYLLTIVKNVALKMLAKRKKEQTLTVYASEEEVEEVLATMEDEAPLPLQQVQSSGLKADLMKAVQELKPVQREVLTLYYMEGKSIAAMTDTLGISSNAVYKRMDAARANLRKLLEKQGYSLEDL